MKYPLALAIALGLFACAQKTEPAAVDSEKAEKETVEQFFPLADYLEGEIAYVDSLPAGIRQYFSTTDGEDSGWMDRDRFHQLAAEFLPPETKEKNFENLFEENSFFDKSSGTSTFFYSARSDSSILRRVDVITAPGDIYDEVKSIYLEKRYRTGDTNIVKRMIWKPKRNFQIITQSAAGGLPPQTTLVKVVWDNRE